MVRPPPHVPDHRLVAPFISVLAHKGLIKSFYRLRTLSRREVFLPAHPPADDLFVRCAGFRLEGPSVQRLLPFPLQPVSQGAFVHPETGGCFPYALMLYQIFRAHDVMLLHLRHGWPLQSRVVWNRDTTSVYRVRESGCPYYSMAVCYRRCLQDSPSEDHQQRSGFAVHEQPLHLPDPH